ncbi:hypothetical protein WJX77_008386 [Trebouxia sp. C0004]
MALGDDNNPYEQQRQQLIARNRARLQALGIGSAVSALKESTPKAPVKPKQQRIAKPALPQQPSRHSSRLQPDTADQFSASAEPSDLALAIVNGVCPCCGKNLNVGHKRHLEQCKGSRKRKQNEGTGHVEIEGLAELEAEEEARYAGSAEEEGDEDVKPKKKSKPSKSQAEKLKELELSGLVDFTQQHARFAVIGSTGSHYNVELKDPAPSCQCVDYRIRKRICKHQKLVLLQLGIPDKPQDWHKAVSAKLDELAQIAPPGRESHLGETEHYADYQQKSQKASAPSASVANHAKSPSAAAAQHPRPARKSAASKVKTDKEGKNGDDWGESAEESTDPEEGHNTQAGSDERPRLSRGGICCATTNQHKATDSNRQLLRSNTKLLCSPNRSSHSSQLLLLCQEGTARRVMRWHPTPPHEFTQDYARIG